MITRNLKNLLCCVPLRINTSTGAKGLLPIKLTDGTIYYGYGGIPQFPGSSISSIPLATSATGSGIVLGSGTTPATENDYRVESVVSGVTGSVIAIQGIDDNKPYLNMSVTVTNNGSTDKTISEICYQQYVSVTATQGGTSSNAPYPMLIDRTVFSTPVTIPPNSSVLIDYRIYIYWGD